MRDYDQLAEEYEKGTWSGHIGEVRMGRPRISSDKLVTISLKVSPASLAAVDRLSKAQGESRSEFLRDAIDKAILAS